MFIALTMCICGSSALQRCILLTVLGDTMSFARCIIVVFNIMRYLCLVIMLYQQLFLLLLLLVRLLP